MKIKTIDANWDPIQEANMEVMRFQSKNLHQHILNTLYHDRSLSDTKLRVMGRDYPCHAGVLAASSQLLQVALNDAQVGQVSHGQKKPHQPSPIMILLWSSRTSTCKLRCFLSHNNIPISSRSFSRIQFSLWWF